MSEISFEQVETPVPEATPGIENKNSKAMLQQILVLLQNLEHGAAKSSSSTLNPEATHEVGGSDLDQKALEQGQSMSQLTKAETSSTALESTSSSSAPAKSALTVSLSQALIAHCTCSKTCASATVLAATPSAASSSQASISVCQNCVFPEASGSALAKSAVISVFCPQGCSQNQRAINQLQPYYANATWIPYTDFGFMIAPYTKWPVVVLDLAHQSALNLSGRGRTAYDFFGWAFEAFFQYRLESEGPRKLELAGHLRDAWKWAREQYKACKEEWSRGEFTQGVDNSTLTVITLHKLLLLYGQRVTITWEGDATWNGVLLRGFFIRCMNRSLGPWIVGSEDIIIEGDGDVPLSQKFCIQDLFISVFIKVESEEVTEEKLFPKA